jgi:hypothetical protein
MPDYSSVIDFPVSEPEQTKSIRMNEFLAGGMVNVPGGHSIFFGICEFWLTLFRRIPSCTVTAGIILLFTSSSCLACATVHVNPVFRIPTAQIQ